MQDVAELFAAVVRAYAEEGFPHSVIGQWTLPENDVADLIAAVCDRKPRKVLEIGTFVGLSTMLIALAGGPDIQVVSIDPNFPLADEMGSMGSNLGHVDATQATHDIARKVATRLGIEDRITFVAGGYSSGATFSSKRTDPDRAIPVVGEEVGRTYGPFDLVFIDGLHYADVVQADLDLASRHLTPNGSILMHDCVGMWGTNVRAGIFRFLETRSEWRFLHPKFSELYRSIGIVFRTTDPAAGELLDRPHLEPHSAGLLQPLVSSLVEHLRPAQVIELTTGEASLSKHFAEFVPTAQLTLEPGWPAHLQAQIDGLAAEGVPARDQMVVSCGAADLIGPSEFSALMKIIADSGVRAFFLRTPPGERGAACLHSRPLRSWITEVERHGANVYQISPFDLAPSRFFFSTSTTASPSNSSLCSAVLIAVSGTDKEPPKSNFSLIAPERAELVEQDELLGIHYATAFRGLFEQGRAATEAHQRLSRDAQRHAQEMQVLRRRSDELLAIEDWQRRILQGRERMSPLWKRTLRSIKTVGLKEIDNFLDVIIAEALIHAARHGNIRPCLMISCTMENAELDKLLADPRVGSAGMKDNRETILASHQVGDERIGRYFHDGKWLLPKGAETVYFIGPIRLLTPSMIATARNAGVENLFTRFGCFWFKVPMEGTMRAARIMRRARSFVGAQRAKVQGAIERSPMLRLLIPAKLRPTLITLDEALAAAIKDAVPRQDFVPGRVILVCGNLAPGGAERQVANTLIGLKKHGLQDVSLLAHDLKPGPGRLDFHLPRVQAAGIPVREIERTTQSMPGPDVPDGLKAAAHGLPSGLAVDIANLIREFRRAKPEVVHAWLDWDNIRAGLAAAIAGVPRILVSGRNLAPINFLLYQPYMDAAYRALVSLPQVQLLNNSRAGADNYADWIGIPRQHIDVIYNGLDFAGYRRATSEERSELRSRLGIAPGAFLVGGVLRFDEEKRPLLWIEVAAQIAARRGCHFVLFGQGVLQPEIEKSIREKGLDSRITLAGVTDSPLTAMSAMDVFLLTSRGEGLPNVLIEAQAVGTPVVCTNAGGASEAVNNGVSGWVVDSDDPSELAEAVVQLHDNPEVRARAEAEGPSFIRDKFSLDRMVRETLDAYQLNAEESTPGLPAGSNSQAAASPADQLS